MKAKTIVNKLLETEADDPAAFLQSEVNAHAQTQISDENIRLLWARLFAQHWPYIPYTAQLFQKAYAALSEQDRHALWLAYERNAGSGVIRRQSGKVISKSENALRDQVYRLTTRANL